MTHATLRLVSLVLSAVTVALLSVSAASASTEIIVDDAFTATTGTNIADHAPDVNLPGTDPNLAAGKYFSIGDIDLGIGGGVGLSPTHPISTTNVARAGNDSGLAISLASRNAYTKPTTFTISADMNLEGMESTVNGGADPQTVGTAGAIGRIALGFYTDTTTQSTSLGRAILGVVYNDAGNLLLVKPSGPVSAQVVAVVNTYGPSNTAIPLTGTHTVSYTVNTVTGGISNVTFDSLAVNFGNSFTNNLFTNTATTDAGWYSRSGSNNDYGLLDNFLVTTEVPEPASLGMLAMGGMMLLRRRR